MHLVERLREREGRGPGRLRAEGAGNTEQQQPEHRAGSAKKERFGHDEKRRIETKTKTGGGTGARRHLKTNHPVSYDLSRAGTIRRERAKARGPAMRRA